MSVSPDVIVTRHSNIFFEDVIFYIASNTLLGCQMLGQDVMQGLSGMLEKSIEKVILYFIFIIKSFQKYKSKKNKSVLL